jgi:hypothetical protein
VKTIGAGFKARLEFILERVFENVSHGGDHQSRAFVAARLLKAAQSGVVGLDNLTRIARDALVEVVRPPKSA